MSEFITQLICKEQKIISNLNSSAYIKQLLLHAEWYGIWAIVSKILNGEEDKKYAKWNKLLLVACVSK